MTSRLASAALACCLALSAAAPQPAGAALAAPVVRSAAVQAEAPVIRPIALLRVQEKKDGSECGQGKRIKAFGWWLVDYGVATLKYLVGLLLVPIGLMLVVIGAILQIVETVAC